MRLDRFISETTGLSRKESSKVVQSAEVTVDGVVQKKGAFKVPQDATVIWNGEHLQRMGPIYLDRKSVV